MADYWKSNPRKRCDVCKCWFADNKISIQLHESGKMHKENVQRRLSELAKKGSERAEAEKFAADTLVNIEKAALEAARKDIEDNPELASLYNARIIRPKTAVKHKGPDRSTVDETPRLWAEARSDEGLTYYWHVYTGDTRWEAPEEGYISIAEQEEQEMDDADGLAADEHPQSSSDYCSSSIGLPTSADERNRKRKTVDNDITVQDPANDVEPENVFGPKVRSNPYGSWQVVEEEPEPLCDEPCQRIPSNVKDPVNVSEENTATKFKEKVVGSLGSSNKSVAFKKRKVGSASRNLKARRDDDD